MNFGMGNFFSINGIPGIKFATHLPGILLNNILKIACYE